MDNVLSATPTFTPTDVTVAPYRGGANSGQQPGGPINACGGKNVAYQNGRLLFTTVNGIPSDSNVHVLWYEFNTNGASPTLTQQGMLNPGPGISTFGPNI